MLDETDPLGNRTEYTYLADGQLESETTPGFDCQLSEDDITTTKGYYDNGQLHFVTYMDGTQIEYVYDGNGVQIAAYDQMDHLNQTAYDSLGNKSSVTDANGNVTNYVTNIASDTTVVTSADGKTEATTYDGNGNPDYVLDWRGLRTDYTYDYLNRIVSVEDPLGNVTSYTYSDNNYLDTVTDAKGQITDYDYDLNGNLLQVTYPDGNTVSYTYDLAGNKTSFTNEQGKTWHYSYDKNNQLISVIDPESAKVSGVYETYTYYDNGLLASKTDAVGRTYHYEYYANGWLKAEKDALGNGFTYEYDTDGNKTTVYDSQGNKTEYEYNDCNWLTRSYTPDDEENPNIVYGYDNVGNKITVTDALGKVWNYHYDEINNLDRVTDPLNHIKTIEYAASTSTQSYVAATDASGNTSTVFYDETGNLESIAGSLGSAAYEYDHNGYLTSFTDGNNHQTGYSYNNRNLLQSTIDALGNEWTYSYNGDGTLLSKTNPDGSTTSYLYNDAGQLIEVDYEDGSRVSYEYYLDGSRKSMTDSNGVTEYTYNAVNGFLETVSRTPAGGVEQIISYHYDDRNLLDQITYPDGKTISYAYDSRGLLDSAEFTEDSAALELYYDANGRADREEIPNGVTVNYIYDDAGQLIGISHGAIEAISYTLAPNGNRDTMETSGGLVQYDYDSQNRLARVDYPDGSHSEYTYDNAGNRIELSGDAFNLDDLPAGTANYLYDDSDRLTGYSDDNITIEYEYDGDGNLCEKITKDGNDNITAHSQYFYDYSADLPRVLAEVDVLNGNVIDYTYGNRLYGKYDSAMYYYHQDGLNNILAVTDASGNVKNTYAYDDFGEVICKNETVSNSILFTGELVDESGLTYLRARFYDPTLGRFLTRDTYAGNIENPQSLNLYTYCANNPVLYIDPSGHMRCSQVDDLFGGIGQGIGDTVVSLLNSPKAILELGDAIISGEITTKQLIEAGLEGLVDDYIYVVKNAYILKPSADVSDATVSAYGKRLGYVISDIATAVAGGKAVKILSKTASGKKIAKALQKATGDENGALRLGEGAGKGFNTFNDAKKFLGSPGQGNQWHHIVEQSQISKSGFSPTQIQNTNNLIAVDSATHAKISGYYSSKQAFTGGKTVRDWLAGQSYEKQFEFGMQKLRDFGVTK